MSLSPSSQLLHPSYRFGVVLLTVGGGLLLGGVGAIATQLPQHLAQQPAQSFDSYEQDCRRVAQQEGLVASDANFVCACTIAEFKRRYSLSEFRQVTQSAKTNTSSAKKLQEVGEKCLENLLFEN